MTALHRFSDHARSRRSRAIPAIVEPSKSFAERHSLFDPAKAGGGADS